MKTGIYKITNPNNRVYIGSSKDIEYRWKHYRNIEAVKTQPGIYNSLRKYGPDNHVFTIIEYCNEDIRIERERYYQDKYDVLGPNGLNCMLASTTNQLAVHSEETKKKISAGNKGKTISQATRDLQSARIRANIANGWTNPNKGKTLNDHEYAHMLASNPNCIPIVLVNQHDKILEGPITMNYAAANLGIARTTLQRSLDRAKPMRRISNKQLIGSIVKRYDVDTQQIIQSEQPKQSLIPQHIYDELKAQIKQEILDELKAILPIP